MDKRMGSQEFLITSPVSPLFRFLGEGRPRKLTKLMKLFFSFSCNNSHNSVTTAMYWVAHTSQGSWQYHTCTAVFGNMSAQYRHKNCTVKKKKLMFPSCLFVYILRFSFLVNPPAASKCPRKLSQNMCSVHGCAVRVVVGFLVSLSCASLKAFIHDLWSYFRR